jgi:proline iminopeptidase
MKLPVLLRLIALFFGLATTIPLHSATPPPKLPEGAFVSVNGMRLWYISEGAGDPLLVVSGGPGVAHYLYPYFSKLSNKRLVIYLDSYGCGNSERALSPDLYTFQRHVDEIDGFRKAMGFKEIDIVGHSYGGMVAQAFAIKYPSSVRRLILASTPHSAQMFQAGLDECNFLIKNHYPHVWKAMLAMRDRGVSPLSKEWTDAAGQIPPALFYNADFLNDTNLILDVTPEMAYSIFGKEADFTVGGELKNFDFRPEIRKLKMPVLVLAGRMDRVAPPAYSEEFKQLIPSSTFVMFEKSGHNLFQEENAKMVEVIGEFLK